MGFMQCWHNPGHCVSTLWSLCISQKCLCSCCAQVGIVHDIRLQELRLFTDYGRCCRPLFIVDLQQQRLHIRKEHIRQLQDRETTNFGWQARLSWLSPGARWR